jgi:DNA-binding NarL/FixJ family response regulator
MLSSEVFRTQVRDEGAVPVPIAVPPNHVLRADAIAVALWATDLVTRAGITALLAQAPGLQVGTTGSGHCDVGLIAGDRPDEAVCAAVRRARGQGIARVLICVTSIDAAGLFMAIQAGATGVIRRRDANSVDLAKALRGATRGESVLPGDLVGTFLTHVRTLNVAVLAPRGLLLSGLTLREAEILRRVAHGLHTREIATQMSYSERTVKNVLHDVTARLQCRNRTHAVAYALRHGLI